MADSDPRSDDFAARRAVARAALDAIDPAMQALLLDDPARRTWFEEVYRRAGDDPAKVPWANLVPHPLTASWIAMQARGLAGLRVLDVGCGLGDNAECFAAAGAKVTAFDLVAEAVAWCQRRFATSSVAYRQADLFALPRDWRAAFDLVHECYTLQALSPSLLPQALTALTDTLKPGGLLLIVSRARDDERVTERPPWPLARSFFGEAARAGLVVHAIEDIHATADVAWRHWRVLLRRPS